MSDPGIDWQFISRVLERYPDIAYLAGDPEILGLLTAATKEEWSPEVLQGRLQQTTYWRTKAPAVRSFAQLEANDPAQAVGKVNATKDQIAALAVQLGGTFDEAQFGDMWWRANREGWTPQQLKIAVANVITPGTSQLTDVNQMASAYLLDISDAEAADYSRRLFTGEIDANTLKSTFADRALAKFPGLKEPLAAGATPADYFADYTTMISRLTGSTTSAVDLIRDPTWQPILSKADAGNVRPMTLDEATKYVRSTDQFLQSSNGQAEAAQFRTAFEQKLGARA